MRPSREDNFLDQARIISRRATCLRRRYGAMLVKDNIILSTGYCGAASKITECTHDRHCLREDHNVPSGERYELCRSVHAEANTIINAAVSGTSIKDAVLYLAGEEADGRLADALPCSMCARMLLNAKIKKVVARTSDGGIKEYSPEDLKRIADSF
jgi:dCMP deaminase